MRLNRIPGIGLLILLAGLMHPTGSLNAQDTLARILTDYQNRTQYLVVRNPYYWKSKIRRR